ncbi:Putative NADPH-dependent methylglyoxal reductase GRP2 [Rhizoctonia solani]|uniref:Putative NADPH-dependent methylglyoxal reductase GRP2 n=1 Tax=Rhizoctonia solani TaxID=456999 RepID=A0A0K6FQG7_9AGAM|nr:Putative NADPH-dependent methylglyoxal reductase GRP2 [Rhizoctonia solani]
MTNTVLLTGGNGFIAVHIIVLLLSHGYSVVTTVRSEGKTTYLRKKFADAVASDQLKFAIVEDITTSGAFDKVLKDNKFDYVLHTSSPFVFTINDITKDLLEPAILGTTEILKAVKANAPTVKRVVVTSSFASIVDLGKGDRPGYVYSEKDWNPITYEESKKDPVSGYYGSKKLAEKAAWDFMEAEKPAFELTTLCPPMVYGPALQEVKSMSNLNASSTAFYALFSGQQKELKNAGVWFWTDVRDIAKAHIAAIEKPEAANERFFICEGRFSVNSVVDYIWKHYPERAQAKGIPKSSPSTAFPETGTYHPDNTKSKNILGIEYHPIESMLKDTLEQFVALEKELGVDSGPSEKH